MKKRVERLRGMHDLLPDTYQHQRWVRDRLSAFLAQAGDATVDSPILERSDLFLASFGQELWQNLYAFRLHNRDLCLRPEYTASICRLYLDHYQQQPLPLRFQYAGPVFRYEAPGRNRYRQHTQLGIELLGGHTASADAEMLQLACDMLNELHITRYRLELGHIGVASGFINRLHLDDHAARLLLSLMEQISRSEEGERLAQARLEALYPLNTTGERSIEDASKGLGSEIEARYITSLLSGISITFDDADARGEIIERFLWKVGRSEQRRQILYALEFLRAIGSARDINACGFAFGVERLLSLLPRGDLPQVPATQALVIPVSIQDMPYALQVARSARTQGMRAEVDVTGHGVGAGLKLATKKQIPLALIVGEDERRANIVTVRNLERGEERILSIEECVQELQ